MYKKYIFYDFTILQPAFTIQIYIIYFLKVCF